MNIPGATDRFQIGSSTELATAPRVVVRLGASPDGLPWLLRVDRSRELSTLFSVVPKVFGLSRAADLPDRVRNALERDVAAGLMGVHDLEAGGRMLRGFVSRKKLKHLLGPTLLAQMLERDHLTPAAESDDDRASVTNVGAMAVRDNNEVLLDAVESSIKSLAAKRHLLVELGTTASYSCAVGESDRALRVPSAPIRPLAFESLAAFGGVEVNLQAASGTWKVPLADRDALHAALLRAYQGGSGGWITYDVPRQHILAQLVAIAREIEALHRKERVHADLAPGNLLVCDGGARPFDGLDIEAGTPATAATFDWAAPEQIVGHPVDPRTDVYALGRIATTILGGVMFGEATQYIVPIGGERSRRVQLLKGEGVFLDTTGTDRDRGWQRAWQDLLGRSISYDRNRRPATGGAFADELAALLERYPVPTKLEMVPKFGNIVEVVSDAGAQFAHLVID
jgi:hypothetical protein